MNLGNPGHLTYRAKSPVLVRLAHELNKQEPPSPACDEGSTTESLLTKDPDGRSAQSA